MDEEEASSNMEVVLGSQQEFPISSPLIPTEETISCGNNIGNMGGSGSNTNGSNLLCYEEVAYDSDDDILADDAISGSSQPSGGGGSGSNGNNNNSPYGIATVIGSSPTQFCGSTPGNAVLFSPNTPWLTSASPQIASTFTNFSPPMQALQAPKLQHFSPPSMQIPSMYSPCITLPGSPQFIPTMLSAGQGDFHLLGGASGDYPI